MLCQTISLGCVWELCRAMGNLSFILLNSRVTGHPLAQNERSLHMFLQEPIIDKNYVPGKVRHT